MKAQKISDWKYLEAIEIHIKLHHSGEESVDETLDAIKYIITSWDNDR